MIVPIRTAKKGEMIFQTVELVGFVHPAVTSVAVASLTVSMKKRFPLICAAGVVPNNPMMGMMERTTMFYKMEYLMSPNWTLPYMARSHTVEL